MLPSKVFHFVHLRRISYFLLFVRLVTILGANSERLDGTTFNGVKLGFYFTTRQIEINKICWKFNEFVNFNNRFLILEDFMIQKWYRFKKIILWRKVHIYEECIQNVLFCFVKIFFQILFLACIYLLPYGPHDSYLRVPYIFRYASTWAY